jgi:hypothetical protein
MVDPDAPPHDDPMSEHADDGDSELFPPENFSLVATGEWTPPIARRPPAPHGPNVPCPMHLMAICMPYLVHDVLASFLSRLAFCPNFRYACQSTSKPHHSVAGQPHSRVGHGD